ncbi:extracellular solute-binding protein [Aggregatibacter actinomycetemcomitans]|uniref:extracellular solute-binding protein n=1 Tax=Aggregatibacter actinomycetemcomitans TaxID=714 RepID=UPI001E5CA584|nr:extracellular solute-binding protein [Aggregatibacter actinomycetemcomitans]
MNKKFTSGLIALSLGLSISGMAVAQDKLIVYTSMKESLIGALKAKFNEKYPDIAMDYQSAGAGKLMAKIATEKESGQIMADVIWTSEVPDFFNMKETGMLETYISPEVENIINPIPDFDGSFTPIRLGTLGIAYNTRFVKKEPPAQWADILTPQFKGAFGIANPALNIYNNPVNKFVFNFIGLSNQLNVNLSAQGVTIDHCEGVFNIQPTPPAELLVQGKALLASRPSEIEFVNQGRIPGIVKRRSYLGEVIDYSVHIGDQELRVQKGRRDPLLNEGESCQIQFTKLHWYPAE